MTDRELLLAFENKLKGSDLTLQDARRKLKMQAFNEPEVKKRFPKLTYPWAGFQIPYFVRNGTLSKFFRFRYLTNNSASGVGALTVREDPLRYVQEPDTLNPLYLPPLVDWMLVSADVKQAIIITEGELKAACGTKNGFPTIGLGGVWCFRARKQGVALLPQFSEFEWKDRPVYICFDSDILRNPDVTCAANALARALLALGAVIYICCIPPDLENASVKVGMDDFIVRYGKDRFKGDVLDVALEWRPSEELFRMNEEVLYVRNPGFLLRLDDRLHMSVREFRDLHYANRIYYEQIQKKTGVDLKERSVPTEWLRWPHRATVPRLMYEPGKPVFLDDGSYNTWPGWGCTPVKGSVQPWHDLLDNLFPTKEAKEDRAWLEQWLAYPLQHPGLKMYCAALLWSHKHGRGKGLVGYSMGKIYGANAVEIDEDKLYSKHNKWAEWKQFIQGDEIASGQHTNTTTDRLKSMITQTRMWIEPKFVDQYQITDCLNYYFTSNHDNALYLEDDDRRFFIYEVPPPVPSDVFFHRYMLWLETGYVVPVNDPVATELWNAWRFKRQLPTGYEMHATGAQYLFYNQLHLKLTIDPTAKAPQNASKQDMLAALRGSSIAAWVGLLKTNPNAIFQHPELNRYGIWTELLRSDIWSPDELLDLYLEQTGKKDDMGPVERERKKRLLGMQLEGQGFLKLGKGSQIKTIKRGKQYLWAIRNLEQWRKADNDTVREHFDKYRPAQKEGSVISNGTDNEE